MKIVIDASVAFLMLASPARVADVFADATAVIAPESIVAQLLDARWKMVRAGSAAPSLNALLGLFSRLQLVAIVSYAADAALLAQRLDQGVYDCLAAVLAKHEHARFATTDRRLAAKLVDEMVDVVTL